MVTEVRNRRALFLLLWLGVLVMLLVFGGTAYRSIREDRERAIPSTATDTLPEARLLDPAEGERQRDRARTLLNAAHPISGSEPAIRGTVVDETKQPVPEASVALLRAGEGERSLELLIQERRFSLTDEEGRFTFPENPPHVAKGVSYSVVARHPDFKMATQRTKAEGERVTIVLLAGLSIRGRVVQGMVRTERGIGRVRVAARGTGAGVATGRSDIFAPVRARFQSTLTTEEGFFELRGLEPGIYQLDVVSSGLVRAPTLLGGRYSLQMRATRARAGDADVVIRVVPLVLGVVRVEDEQGGTPIADARLRLSLPEGWRYWPKDIVNSYQHVVVNGRGISIEPVDLFPGCMGFLLIPDRWPLPSETAIRAFVSAADYEEGQGDVLLRPAGEGGIASRDGTLVKLRPTSPRSIARFVLRDRRSAPVGPVVLTLRCEGERTGTHHVRVVFDSNGKSHPVALPADEYREIFAAPHPAAGPLARTRQDRFDLTKDLAGPIVLHLQASGLLIEPTDEAGNSLDDVTVRVGTGHRPVQVEYKRVNGVITWEGSFLKRAGLGEWKVRPILGATQGLCTVEAYRHGYESTRVFTTIRPGGYLTRVVLRLKANPVADWDNWIKRARNDLDDVSNAD